MLLRSLILGTLLALAPSTMAATVSFHDLSAKDEEHLKKTLPKLLTSDVDQATLDESIRVLMSRGYYENVFVERKANGNYEIIGKPLRVIEEIKFAGVHEVSESDLRDLVDFKIGDRFDRKRAVASAEKIKNYYGEHGYFNAVVELNFQKTESKNIRLVFDVNEKEPCLIKTLNFETPNTDLKALLNSKFKRLKKKPLTTDRARRLMQDLANILIDHRYLAPEIVGPDAKYNPTKTEAYMSIEVHDPYRYEFYFDGNKFFTTVDVYRALDLTNRERKNVDPASEGAERLRRAYLDKGLPNVQIETKVITPPEAPFLRRVYYTINEGPRVRIKAIEIQGRVTHNPKYYENIILNNSSDLVAKGWYNRADLETGFKNLTTELRNQGYLRARVLSSRIEYNDKRDQATVILLLEEGPQTQIRGLDFTGNKFFSNFELAEVTGLETNTPLRLPAFEESLARLKDFYHRQGFIEMRLLNESSDDIIKYNDKGTQARIQFQIYEGPRVRVHSIVIEGNTMTQARVILKEADFQLGEVLTPQKIDDATTRLRRLNIFSRVEIHTQEENTNISERTLQISVTESLPGTFTPGIGVTNERNLTLRGYASISYNNIKGTARAVSARAEIRNNVAEVRYNESDITVGYLEPFLFDTRTRGRINLTRKEYVYDYRAGDPTPGPSFADIIQKNRVDFLTERDLTAHTKFTYKLWSLESRTEFERYHRCLPDPKDDIFHPEKGKCSANVMQVSTIGPQLDIDYRDNPFLPTSGTYTHWSFDYSNPNLGSSQGVEFYKTELSFTHYKQIGSPKIVWANSARGGYLSNQSRQDGSGVPSDYVFELGGISTLRGFDLSSPNERIPKDGDDGWFLGTANDKRVARDSNYYLLKSEMRFTVFGNYGFVLFYDGGAVRVSGYHFRHTYRDNVGFGLRYNTPVGPVALDFAFKLNPEGAEYVNGKLVNDPESPLRVQFSIGTF